MSLSSELTGVIINIEPTQQISEKFSKRGFVLKIEDGQYPQEVPLQFTGDKCAKLDAFAVGMEVKVSTNLRGRGYDKKDGSGRAWFLTLEAWRIESAGNAPAEPMPNHYTPKPAPKPTVSPVEQMSEDDLPF